MTLLRCRHTFSKPYNSISCSQPLFCVYLKKKLQTGKRLVYLATDSGTLASASSFSKNRSSAPRRAPRWTVRLVVRGEKETPLPTFSLSAAACLIKSFNAL